MRDDNGKSTYEYALENEYLQDSEVMHALRTFP